MIFDEIKSLPIKNQIKILLEILVLLGRNIENCERIYEHYWLKEAREAQRSHLETCEKIKKRIIEIFDEINP